MTEPTMPDATSDSTQPETPPPGPGFLDQVVVVLDQTQDLVNIAGVVRAMKNMGLKHLRLVRPAEFDAWRITGIAHRSDDIVERAEILDTLEEAVGDCVLVVGTSARARTAHRNYGYARDWAREMLRRAPEGKVALVFGREDRGLTNEALDLCHGVAIIPTDPDYSSLNMAQAFLVLAYELFLTSQEELPPLPKGRRVTGPATRERMETMFRALEGGLDRIEFFKARRAESVMRTVRTLLSRAEPDQQEAGLIQAIGFEISSYMDRELGKRGEDRGDASPEA